MLASPVSRLQVEVVRDIAADAATIFDTILSPAGMRAWAPGCESAHWVHPAGVLAPGIGSVRHLRLQGGHLAIERIVGWEQGRALQYVMEAPVPVVSPLTCDYVGVTRVEARGPRAARVTWQLHFETPGLKRLAAPVLRSVLRGAIDSMLRSLARAAEAA